jgi:hypothetical protein
MAMNKIGKIQRRVSARGEEVEQNVIGGLFAGFRHTRTIAARD